jgi:hypothetical protein
MRRTLALLAFLLAALLAVPAVADDWESARPDRHTCPQNQLAYPAASFDDTAALAAAEPDTVQAVEYAGIAEGQRSWYDAAQNRFYTMHIRSSVAHEPVGTCSDPDYWAYRAHVWCTSEYGPLTYTTACNYDVEHAALKVKYCREFTTCPSSEPFGGGPWHRDNDSDYVFQGDWHIFGTPGTQSASLLSASDHFQVRFLSSTGQHLSSDYVGCSAWVWEGNTDYQADAWCSGLVGPV